MATRDAANRMFVLGLAILALCPLLLIGWRHAERAWFGFGVLAAAGLALANAGRGRSMRRALAEAPPLSPTAIDRRLMDDLEHELRTPLAALMLVGENALAKLPAHETGALAIASMLDEARHLRDLLQHLVASAREEDTGEAQAPRSIEDLRALARHGLRRLAGDAARLGQRIEFVGGTLPLPVSVRAPLMQQAVVNLVRNAIEHCPAGTTITVRTHIDAPGRAALVVEDDGPGIAPEAQARLFRRAVRGEARARLGGNRGLGLANALAVARCHGGSIALQSIPAEGARFTLRLPLATTATVEDDAPEAERTAMDWPDSLSTDMLHPPAPTRRAPLQDTRATSTASSRAGNSFCK